MCSFVLFCSGLQFYFRHCSVVTLGRGVREESDFCFSLCVFLFCLNFPALCLYPIHF